MNPFPTRSIRVFARPAARLDCTFISGGLYTQPSTPNKLKFDWSQIVKRDGTQLVTVGTHWPMSRALNKEELDTLIRAGACMGCHQNMVNKQVWAKVSEEGRLNPQQHIDMMNKMIQYMDEKAQKGKDW